MRVLAHAADCGGFLDLRREMTRNLGVLNLLKVY